MNWMEFLQYIIANGRFIAGTVAVSMIGWQVITAKSSRDAQDRALWRPLYAIVAMVAVYGAFLVAGTLGGKLSTTPQVNALFNTGEAIVQAGNYVLFSDDHAPTQRPNFGTQMVDSSPGAMPEVSAHRTAPALPETNGMQTAGYSNVSAPAPAAESAPVVVEANYPASTAGTERTHKIMPGDTLSKLARVYYHDSDLWRTICDANRDVLSNCSNIRVGVSLRIPAVGKSTWSNVAAQNAGGGNEIADNSQPLAADGRVYYDVAMPEYVPAQVAVTGGWSNAPARSYVEGEPRTASPAPVPTVAQVVIQPTPAPVVAAVGRVMYDVPTVEFTLDMVADSQQVAAPAPAATPRPQPTPATAQANTSTAMVEYAFGAIDTSAPSIGGGSSGSTVTINTP